MIKATFILLVILAVFHMQFGQRTGRRTSSFTKACKNYMIQGLTIYAKCEYGFRWIWRAKNFSQCVFNYTGDLTTHYNPWGEDNFVKNCYTQQGRMICACMQPSGTHYERCAIRLNDVFRWNGHTIVCH